MPAPMAPPLLTLRGVVMAPAERTLKATMKRIARPSFQTRMTEPMSPLKTMDS